MNWIKNLWKDHAWKALMFFLVVVATTLLAIGDTKLGFAVIGYGVVAWIIAYFNRNVK